MKEFVASIYFKWLLVDFFSFFIIVFVVALLFVKASSSTRLEETALKGYLTGIILHTLVTITFGILTVKVLYQKLEPWRIIWAYNAGFISFFLIEILLVIILILKIRQLPELNEL